MTNSTRIISALFFGAFLSFMVGTSSAFTPLQARNSQQSWRVSTSTSPQSTDSNASTTMRNIPFTALSAQRDTLTMMPSVLEKPAVRTGGPAVLDRPAVEKKQNKEAVKERKSTGSEVWEVRIYNDGTNTREFVARCLVQITALSENTAFETMMEAHRNGLAVVGRYVFEIAEMYHNALKENGIVCDLVPVDEEK